MANLCNILVMLSLLVAPAAWAANTVAHNPQVQLDRATIRLGDVFSGLPATADVEIATAPNPGKNVVYDYSVLSKLAQRYNLDWQVANYNDKSVITRVAQHITPDMIRDAVIDQLKAQGVTGEIDILLDQRSIAIDLPTDVKLGFSLHDFNFDKNTQRFRTELLAAVDTPAFQQITLSGRASTAVAVPVLNKTLAQGIIISKADLDWIKLPAERSNDYIRTAEALVGMELKRQMPEQSALRPQDLLPARVVLQGNLVTMQVIAPGMMLTAQGRALQDGAVGDVIRVTNTQSKRVVEGKIISAGLVQIMLNPQLASLQ